MDLDFPYLNREIRRKVNRYASKHNLSFIDAYNKLYKTNYSKNCLKLSSGIFTDINKGRASFTDVMLQGNNLI